VDHLAAKLARARSLHQQGELQRARFVYDEILAVRPNHFDALSASALLAAQGNDFVRAVELFDKAIAVDPRQPAAYCNRGLAEQHLRRLQAALASYDRAIALKHDYAIAHFNRGNVLRQLHDPAAALASYRRAMAIQPQWGPAILGAAAMLRELGEPDAAVALYDRALTLAPNSAQIHLDKSIALASAARLDEAVAGYHRALEIQPQFAEAHSNLGIVLARLGRTREAIARFETAIAIRETYADAHYNRSKLLQDAGAFDEALAGYERTLALAPELAEAHWNRALILLTQGDYERGLPEYEWRWRTELWRNAADSLAVERRDFGRPHWRGDAAIADSVIFLHAEQGFGDTLQFCRYVQGVSDLGATVILEVQRELMPLLAGLPKVARLLARGDPVPAFDHHCPLASLPLAFGTTVATIPARVPYLSADPARIDFWSRKLGHRSRPRIGLVWSGRASHVNDHNRSIRLGDLLRHLPPEFDYVSLQNEVRDTDLAALESCPRIARFEPDLVDFGETAALCACLDLVLCVDTSVAHLNAAMGRKTWLLVPAIPDWRWLSGRNDSPWYPTMTLFRQTRSGEWRDVFERLEHELKALITAGLAG
jgi:tetratricopeptide (TPR) repeat protein